MFIRPCYRTKGGKRHAYWALVESHRTDRGPRQRVVAYLGQLKEGRRLGAKRAAEGKERSPYRQLQLFDHDDRLESEWIEIDTANVRVENQLDFGGPWLALELIRKLKLDELLESVMPPGKEDIPWSRMAIVLAISRLCNPSSELHIAEHYYPKTAIATAWKSSSARHRTAARKCLSCVAAKIVAKKRRRCTIGLRSGSTRRWKR